MKRLSMIEFDDIFEDMIGRNTILECALMHLPARYQRSIIITVGFSIIQKSVGNPTWLQKAVSQNCNSSSITPFRLSTNDI